MASAKKGLTVVGTGLLAVACQWAAVDLLWYAHSGIPAGWMSAISTAWSVNQALTGFFIVQFFAAFCGTGFLLSLSPERMRGSWRQGLLFGTCFIFLLPVAGQLVLGSVLVLRHLFRRPAELHDVPHVGLPTFVPKLLDLVRPGGTARTRSLIVNQRVAIQERVSAMNAVRTVAPHVTGGLLHALLSDEQDEIRLLAYGILDRTEKQIMQDIRAIQANLGKSHNSRRAAVNHAHLAELHWELLYQGLALGEVYRYTLDRVQEHARQALAVLPKLAGMYFLLGRCALIQRAPRAALGRFSEAKQHGMSQAHLAPWVAEAHFQERRLAAVGIALQDAPLLNASGDLQAVVRYWQ